MPDHQQTKVGSHPAIVVGVLSGIAVTLVLMNFVFFLLHTSAGRPHVFGLSDLFDLNQEGNIPTFFSAAILLLCSSLFAIIWVFKRRQPDRFSWHWGILAAVLFCLSIDEAAGIHELFSMNIKRFIDTGWLYYPWVVAGVVFVVGLAAVMARFVLHLPEKTKRLFCSAGIVYFGGAVGMEIFAGRHHAFYGDDNSIYRVLVMIEESLEMAGVLILMFALLDYMRTNGYQLLLCFRPVE